MLIHTPTVGTGIGTEVGIGMGTKMDTRLGYRDMVYRARVQVQG